MGRLEKIVVVTVLFLVAIILGISLNTKSEAEAKNPVAGRGPAPQRGDKSEGVAKAPVDNAPAVALPGAGADKSGAQPSGLMSTAGAADNKPQPGPAPLSNDASKAVAPAPAANANAAPVAQPQPVAPRYLVSSEGLEPTMAEELMLYTWKQGDTFSALAQRYYGSPLHAKRIQDANEGVNEKTLVAGAKVNISVKPATAENLLSRSPSKAEDPAAAGAKWTGGPYTVKTGDVLGTISAQVYGTSKQWKKIYDANRDVIGDDPNKLKVGSKLRIPE